MKTTLLAGAILALMASRAFIQFGDGKVSVFSGTQASGIECRLFYLNGAPVIHGDPLILLPLFAVCRARTDK